MNNLNDINAKFALINGMTIDQYIDKKVEEKIQEKLDLMAMQINNFIMTHEHNISFSNAQYAGAQTTISVGPVRSPQILLRGMHY